MNEKFHSFDKHIMIGFEKNREPFIGVAPDSKLWCSKKELHPRISNTVFLFSIKGWFKTATGELHYLWYKTWSIFPADSPASSGGNWVH